jgi:hypothetical protein
MALRSMSPRAWYHWTYVAPSSILSPDPTDSSDTASLRTEASCDGICYLRVTRSLADDTYVVRVAARPELLTGASHTVLLSEAQLAQALPWDCRLQGKSSILIKNSLQAHSASHQKSSRRQRISSGQSPQNKPSLHTGSSTARDTVALPHVFVSVKDFQQAVGTMEQQESSCGEHQLAYCKTCQHRWIEIISLRAVLLALKRKIWLVYSDLRNYFQELEHLIRSILVTRRYFRQQLVYASAVDRSDQIIGWWVQIDAPLLLVG